MKCRIFLILAVLSSSAEARLVEYRWESNGSSAEVLSGAGYFRFDENDAVAGADLSGLLKEFFFEYRTIAGVFDIGSQTTHTIVSQAFRLAPGSLEMLSHSFCASTIPASSCVTSGHPLIVISNNFPTIFGIRSGWNATFQTGGNSTPFIFGEQRLVRVSVPATTAMLGLGLISLLFRHQCRRSRNGT